MALKDDAELDLKELEGLLRRVMEEIHSAPDAVRYAMNQFIICVGGYVAPLTGLAITTGEEIGPVSAYLGDNNCEVFSAPDYIRKMQAKGVIGKKRKTVKC